MAGGNVLIFGPVRSEEAVWGLAVLTDQHQVRELMQGDPAISTRLATFEVGVMPVAAAAPGVAPLT